MALTMNNSQVETTLNKLDDEYKRNETSRVLVKFARFTDLVETLGSVLNGLNPNGDETDPQTHYSRHVVKELENLDFYRTLLLLDKMADFCDSEFAFCTVGTSLNRFPRPTPEEFKEFKGFYVHNAVLNETVSSVYPVELIRAIRFYCCSILHRFFGTYDVTEKRDTKDGRELVCVSESATFRVGNSQRTSDDFVRFLELVCQVCQYFHQFETMLTEFVTPFRDAATLAKQMRDQQPREPRQREDRQPRQQREDRQPRQREDRQPRQQREDRQPRQQREDRQPRQQREDRQPREQQHPRKRVVPTQTTTQ
jgi:hypothetical protein